MSRMNTDSTQHTNVTEVQSVTVKSCDLGVRMPDGIAFLPTNFFTADSARNLRYMANALDVKALFAGSQISSGMVTAGDGEIPYVMNRDANWVGPTLYFSAALVSENPEIVTLAIEIIKKHVIDVLRGNPRSRVARFSAVVENTHRKKTMRIDYEGPAESLAQVDRCIRGLLK